MALWRPCENFGREWTEAGEVTVGVRNIFDICQIKKRKRKRKRKKERRGFIFPEFSKSCLFGAKMAHYHYLAKKISNLPLFWKYIRIYHLFETRVCRETRVWRKTRVPKARVLWKNILQIFWKIFYVILVHETRVP